MHPTGTTDTRTTSRAEAHVMRNATYALAQTTSHSKSLSTSFFLARVGVGKTGAEVFPVRAEAGASSLFFLSRPKREDVVFAVAFNPGTNPHNPHTPAQHVSVTFLSISSWNP
jgi:hypothetical protein